MKLSQGDPRLYWKASPDLKGFKGLDGVKICYVALQIVA